MYVGYLSSSSDAESIWVGGETNPDTFQANTIAYYDMPSTMQYMCHAKTNGGKVASPGLQYNSIAIWDGDSGSWIVGTP